MALSKTVVKTIYGKEIQLEGAYITIGKLSGNKNGMQISVDVFTDTTKSEIIDNYQYSFIPLLNGDNFIAQAYEYLKTLPEYADIIDC